MEIDPAEADSVLGRKQTRKRFWAPSSIFKDSFFAVVAGVIEPQNEIPSFQ